MTTPLPPKQFTTVDGHRLAHVEMGQGAPIVLLHGNPTSIHRTSRGHCLVSARRDLALHTGQAGPTGHLLNRSPKSSSIATWSRTAGQLQSKSAIGLKAPSPERRMLSTPK